MKPRTDREEGILLIEMMFGLTILTVGLLGFFMSYTANFSAAKEIASNDEATAAMEDIVETLRGADFDSLYTNYQYAWFEVPSLQIQGTYSYYSGGTYGTYNYSYPAYAYVYFYVNEPSLPSNFGPVLDLDGDGALSTANVSTNYDLLPARVMLWYSVGTRYEFKDLYVVLGERD